MFKKIAIAVVLACALANVSPAWMNDYQPPPRPKVELPKKPTLSCSTCPLVVQRYNKDMKAWQDKCRKLRKESDVAYSKIKKEHRAEYDAKLAEEKEARKKAAAEKAAAQ